MDLEYKNRRLEKELTDPQKLIKAYGTLAKRLNQRLKEFTAADSLQIIKSLPAAKCHELTGDRNGQLAVKISGNYRLIFEPYHDPIPKKDDGGLDYSNIVSIKILEIEDYH